MNMPPPNTASVRTLRNEYARLIELTERGESVTILRRGKPVARLVPVAKASVEESEDGMVDWSRSAALALRIPRIRDDAALRELLDDNKGRY